VGSESEWTRKAGQPYIYIFIYIYKPLSLWISVGSESAWRNGLGRPGRGAHRGVGKLGREVRVTRRVGGSALRRGDGHGMVTAWSRCGHGAVTLRRRRRTGVVTRWCTRRRACAMAGERSLHWRAACAMRRDMSRRLAQCDLIRHVAASLPRFEHVVTSPAQPAAVADIACAMPPKGKMLRDSWMLQCGSQYPEQVC
jgi:hypothetical protein